MDPCLTVLSGAFESFRRGWLQDMGEVPKLGTFGGVPITRIIVFWNYVGVSAFGKIPYWLQTPAICGQLQFTPPPGLELRAQPGSFGHPEMCSRRCVYIFENGVCPHGCQCRYFHGTHETEPMKIGKHLRKLCARMSREERMSIVLRHFSN